MWSTWLGTEVFSDFSVLVSSEEDSIGTGWVFEDELIEGVDLSSGLENSVSSRLGDLECTDLECWDIKKSHVVSDGSDKNSDLGFSSFHVSSEL